MLSPTNARPLGREAMIAAGDVSGTSRPRRVGTIPYAVQLESSTTIFKNSLARPLFVSDARMLTKYY